MSVLFHLISVLVLVSQATADTDKRRTCELPIVPGPCEASIERWGFDSVQGKCVPFFYGGCQGNRNNFLSRAECDTTCPRTDICLLPVHTVSRPCVPFKFRWVYDKDTGRCEQLADQKCAGNENNFISQDECLRVCSPSDWKPCSLPGDVGTDSYSTGAEERWAHNAILGICEQFTYKGAGGNANNFRTREACNLACPSISVCGLESQRGSCSDVITRWYFNRRTGLCETFIYSNCDGNRNNFETKAACETSCKPRDDQNGCPLQTFAARSARYSSQFSQCGPSTRNQCKPDQICCWDGGQRFCTQRLRSTAEIEGSYA